MAILPGIKLRIATIAIAIALLSMASPEHLAAQAPASAEPNRITGAVPDPDWQEQFAYTLGVQAYIFSFPWYYSTYMRCTWVTREPDPREAGRRPYAPVGELFHFRNLADADYRDGGAPNNDTLYSMVWLDVGKEPVVISVPDMGDRYYSVELMAYNGDNFDYLGSRTRGSAAGNYAIVGPGWKGELPAGVQTIAPAPTPWVLALFRTYIAGEADLEAVHAVQDHYRVTPLSRWGKAATNTPGSRDVFCPYDRKDDPLADFKTINRAMTENPPPPAHAALVDMFAQIGIGPGQDVEAVAPATRRGLVRALEEGSRLLTGAARVVAGTRPANGWLVPPATIGRAGDYNDFLFRGVVNLLGFATNDAAEAVYIAAIADSKGRPLDGNRRYSIHFTREQLPPVEAFWSFTVYGQDNNLVANAIDRYSIGDRTQGLQYDADGGLTLYLQHASPGGEKAANWLPIPENTFKVYLRLYLPGPPILEGNWVPPEVLAL